MKKRLKKSLSQNFLIDENIKKNIIKFLDIKKNDIVIEVGPGNGSITNYLSRLTNNLFLIEIDTDLVKNLNFKLNNVKIYNDDILKFNFKLFFKKFGMARLIGNLPYKISSKILFRLIEIKDNLLDVHFVVQKELADKFIKNQSNVLIFIISYYFKVIKIFDINPNSFFPIPKIYSSFIKLIPYKNKKIILNFENFKFIIKSLLNKRRKIIFKFACLAFYYKYIDLFKRSSNITLLEFIRISNLYTVNKKD